MSENFVYPVKKGHDYTVTIESLAFGGKGVARVEEYVLFVRRALPGDICRVRITKRKRSFGEARILSIEQPSPLRIQPPCGYFEWCGGCTWQNMSYENQLLQKKAIVEQSFKRPDDLGDVPVLDTLACETPYGYRNKMEFSFADRKWLTPEDLDNPDISKAFALGLHVPGTFDKILHIEQCLLQSDTANAILKFISRYVQDAGLPAYGIRSHEGLLRFLVLRQSRASGEIMVNLVTSRDARKELTPLARELRERFGEVSSVVNNVNSRKAQIAQGEEEFLLAGRSVISDTIGPFRFDISANSFFQTNTAQAEKLYNTALEFAALSGRETVWDLYCGTGTITLFLARRAKKVYGFEIVESAIKDARNNAARYGMENIRWFAGDVREHMSALEERPDVLVTDPPRAGMHPDVVETLLRIRPRRIVYVSCNPTTLARDLKILQQAYTVVKARPVDMFPQTYHIETVALLEVKAE